MYQAACDVLLMPYQRKLATSSGSDTSGFFSPMKLFEYLACGRVILSSDLPVLREVLNESNSILLPPDDAGAWVSAIREAQSNRYQYQALMKQASSDVQQYTWEERAKLLMAGVGSTNR
jgi:glycosyltransferase involved in cell wall biosynthesis